MFHQLYVMPRDQEFILACSGGVDSMAIASFYQHGGKKPTLAYFDHGTGNKDGALPVIQEYAAKHSLRVEVGTIQGAKPKDQSPEEFWRNERYRWLHSFQLPVVTAHHLGDAQESWLFGMMHGKPKLISACIEGGGKWLYRPFLTNTKEELLQWCVRHEVKWFEDTSNANTHYPRNRIRHVIMPEVLKINPGFAKVIRKKLLAGCEACIDLE